ncbi:MAG: hypothetical protein LUQ25_07525 [Methanoregulaceae archaeon]|nr:hypothetical protein [Methanoregulaceae archaeon]
MPDRSGEYTGMKDMSGKLWILCLVFGIILSISSVSASTGTGAGQENGNIANVSGTPSPGTDAVTWQKVYTMLFWTWGANSISQTPDGGYIIGGDGTKYDLRTRTSVQRAVIVKLDPNGGMQWMKSYGGRAKTFCKSVRPTPDGGYIIAQFGQENGMGWMFLIKTDAAGTVQWRKKVGTNEPIELRVTRDGGYAILFGVWVEGKEQQMVLLKTDSNGVKQWMKLYGGPGINQPYSFEQTSDGGFIILGDSGRPMVKMYLVKTGDKGAVAWQKIIGNENVHHYGRSIVQTADGGYAITGEITGNPGGIAVIKTGPAGGIKWQKSYPLSVG